MGGLGSSGAAASDTSPDMEQARLSEQLNHRTSESLVESERERQTCFEITGLPLTGAFGRPK